MRSKLFAVVLGFSLLTAQACRTNQSNGEAEPQLTKDTSATNSTEKNNVRTSGFGANDGGNSTQTAAGKGQVSGQPASQSGDTKK